MSGRALILRNPGSASIADLPVLSPDEFRSRVLDAVEGGARLAALFAAPAESLPGSRSRALVAALAHDGTGEISLFAGETGLKYPALTTDCPQAHWFEREIWEQEGIVPEGHPWLKPIRFQPRDHGRTPEVGVTDFFRMEGEEVHEVAVGPVHAGVIEPGHFRFQCQGETVFHLEISLGYQHRGIERALLGGPGTRAVHHIETLAGDSSIGHATAFAMVLEGLCGTRTPARAEALRAVAAELERIANHVGDLGALAGDVGFLPTQNYCGRIRGDALNLTAAICGNRFGRGLVLPGGAGFDVEPERASRMIERLKALEADARGAVELMFNTPSVMARFEGTGIVESGTAASIGLVGPAARASGLERDVRSRHPYGLYRFAHIPACTIQSGDCLARATVRWLEIKESLAFIGEALQTLPKGDILRVAEAAEPGRIALAMTEGWRGEICHVAFTGPAGRFSRYKITDPSFHNWFGLACSLRNQQISDFPLCNKSFNLSYCGHDL